MILKLATCFQDPHDVLKEKCTATSTCTALKEKLDECSDRVNSKSNTTETCYEELIDLIQCVDHFGEDPVLEIGMREALFAHTLFTIRTLLFL
ncbi:hypothetical protein HAZT_HAZT007243 [Hyalella azteca]|uniref:Ubiquinol-cytochrome C reductase hinge domain-containing protein n=1 Tax=Hyalella azteca TaxID=294128 RepID=A0A6A0GVG1_HYAAZ|nr:hypothetical protein HAZT_HAZT007243 [Hyalella azteca]